MLILAIRLLNDSMFIFDVLLRRRTMAQPTAAPVPLSALRYLERTRASEPMIHDIEGEVRRSLGTLALPPARLRGRRIAVAAGSRGIASIAEVVRAACALLRELGADPFVFPAMGSHGGGTAEGQRRVLADYGITAELVGAEIRSEIETVTLGRTPEGFGVFMDRNAWQSDGVLVINRTKPHTDFYGTIESGVLKMITIGIGKVEGARESHHWFRKCGNEKVIRAVSGHVLETGKILCGLELIENEFHQLCEMRAALPQNLVAVEEESLCLARRLVPRLPFSRLDLLIVDEMGKNIAGSGLDTKVIGRGVRPFPASGARGGNDSNDPALAFAQDAPEITAIYVRDLTPESEGNAIGMGFTDVIHDRLYQKVDFEKLYLNARTSLNPLAARMPMHLASDRGALALIMGALGSPDASEQRVVWIRNTLSLSRIAISEALWEEAGSLDGFRLEPDLFSPGFADNGDLLPCSVLEQPALSGSRRD